jgi:YD repeat-containing protein
LNTSSYTGTDGGSISGTVYREAYTESSGGDWNLAQSATAILYIASSGTNSISALDVTSNGQYTVTIPANQYSAPFTIKFNQTTNANWDRTGTLNIVDGVVDSSKTQTASLTLLDNVEQVAVLLNSSAILEGGASGANQTTIRFWRNYSVLNGRTINYSLSGTATAGIDYTPAIGTITIPQGSNETDVTITATNATQSINKTLTVTLLSGAYQYYAGYSNATLSIMSDMPTVEAYFTNSGILEGQSTALAIVRTNGYYSTSGPHTIAYAIGGTARNGIDYTSLSGLATIPVGTSYIYVPLTTYRNTVTNDNKTITLTLISSNSYQIASGWGTATANVVDDTPIIGVYPSVSTILQGQTESFEFYNDNAHAGTPAITVNYGVGGTAANGVDYTPTLSGSLQIPAGTYDSITNVTATFYPNPTGTKTMTVTVITNAYVLDPSYPSTTIGIQPDISTVSVTASEPYAIQPGGVGQFTVSRSGGLDRSLTVNCIVTGTATAGVNYPALPSSVTFAANQSTANLNVTANASPSLTGAATVVLTLATNTAFFAGADSQAVVTLLPSSDNTNSVTSPVGRYWRGSGSDPTFWSQVIPVEGEAGTVYSNMNGNALSLYGIGSWSSGTFYHYNATNLLSQTNSTYRIPYNNPIVAFGERVGGTPLYVNQSYSFGVYAGDPMPIQAPFVIAVYNRSDFSVAGFIGFNPPNIGNTNSWNNYTSNGFQVVGSTNYLSNGTTGTTNTFGLTTILSDSPNLNWGTQSGTSQTRGAYVLTHFATTQATNYYYIVQAYGWLATVGAPIAQTSGGSYAPSMLYSLEFEQRPNWRSTFIDQPHFDGSPLPPFYAGKTLAEMLTNTPPVTNIVNFTPSAATNLDDSPELRRHPILDNFVASMGNDPIALANYVINSIDLTDPMDYSDSGMVAEQAINPTGVTRGALGAFMEKQGSPIDQCALLVYLLRQAGVPAVYEFPPRGGLQMLDARLSRILKFQVHGGYNEAGQLYTTNTMITVNYPWVAAYIGTNWVHIFPWLKDYDIVEGLNLYDEMPTNYSNAYGWVHDYIYGNSNLLSLAVSGDNTPRVIFPRFLQQTLLQNHPGISVDDIGVDVYNRQHYYARWQDFPTPTWVTNVSYPLESLTASAITNISPTLTNIFDTVSVEIYSDADPTKDIKTGDMRLVDLHNREFYIYQTAPNTNHVQLNLTLLPFRTNITTQASFTNDPGLTNKQVLSLTLDQFDDQLTIRFKYFRHRALSAAYPIDPNTPFLGLNDYMGQNGLVNSVILERPLRKGDQAAICMSYGRVTRDMLNLHANDLWQMQSALQVNPALTNSLSPDVYEGATMYLAGMSYYEKWSEFDQFAQNLNKMVNLSTFDIGLSMISPARDRSGNLTNNIVYPVLPTVDMFYYNTAFTGNGTVQPNSGQTAQSQWQNYALLSVIDRSAEEHQVINTYYQQTNAVSTVRLLQLAQSSGAGIVALNINNINAQGTTVYQGQQLGLWDADLWSQIITAFSATPQGYVTAYITPGPMTNSAYEGMAALVLGWGNWEALISPQSLNGAFGQPFQLLSISAGNTINYQLNNDDGYTLTFNQPASDSTIAPTTASDIDYLNAYNGILNNTFSVSYFDSTWMNSVNSVYNLPGTGTQNQNYAAAYQANAQNGNVGCPDDGGSTLWSTIMDPVHAVTGEFYVNETDLQLPGPMPLALRRNYSSQNLADNQFGTGWKLSIMPYLAVSPNQTNIYAADMDGAVLAYVQTATNASVWLPSLAANPQLNNETTAGAGGLVNRLRDRLVQTVNGSTTNYTLYGADGSTRAFQVMTFNNGILNQTRPYLQQWTDSRGNYYTFTFGTNASQPNFGEVTRIQCSNGNFLGLDYDIYAHVIDAYCGDGRRLIYDYDQYGDLITVTLPDATTRSYQYQHLSQAVSNGSAYYSTHLITEEDKPDGRVLQNFYDNQRRVTNQWSTAGADLNPIRTATFVYANNFNITNSYTNAITGYTLIVDGNGNTNRYDYANSLITKITDPLGQTIQQTWNADNATAPGYPRSVATSTDKRGVVTQYQYDGNGNVTNTIVTGDLTGDGITTQTATNMAIYNANSLPVMMTDPAGNSVGTVYDPVFNFLPQQIIRYAGAIPVSTNYLIYGNATNVVINGNVTQTNLAFGLPIRRIQAFGSPDAATNDFVYDGHGFPTQSTRYTGTTDPNVTTTFFYNERGLMADRVDSLGAVSFFDYDALNRPIEQEIFDEFGNALAWSFNYYNDNGELSWVDGPRYNPEDYIYYDYDGMGRRSTEIHWLSQANPNGTGVEAPSGYNLYSQSFYAYDPLGNLLRSVDPRGAITTYAYNAIAELVQSKHLDIDGATVLSIDGYGYEPGGQVRYHTNGLGGVTTTLYTATGQPEFRSNPDGSTNAWRYYLDGRIKREIQSNGAYWQTTYDDLNRITTRAFCSAGGTVETTTSTQRDRRGNVIQTVDADSNLFTSTFDDLDRLKITAGPAITTVTSNYSGMSPSGPLTYQTNLLRQVSTNFYDAAGRAVTNINALGEKTVALMDALGRTTSTLIYGSSGILVRERYFSYSADHNSVTVTDGSGSSAISHSTWTDPNGRTVLSVAYPASGTLDYTWKDYDLAGNLAYEQHDTSSGGGWTFASYGYDGLNRRIAETNRDSAVTTYGFDALGDMVRRTMPGGLQWHATNNNAGLELQDWLVGTDGITGTRTNTYTYFLSGSPFAGLVNTKTDGRGLVNTFAYDDRLRLASISRTDPNYTSLNTSWGYDPCGYVTNISEQFGSDGLGNYNPKVISRSFDPYGQVSAEIVTVGGTAFSSAGQTWDPAGRRTGLTINGASYGFSSRADGALIYASNPTGSGSYAFDTAGLLTGRTVGPRTTTITARDGEGRPFSISTAVNGAQPLTESLVWNGDGTLYSDTLYRSDFTDYRLYAYAGLTRRLTQEKMNLNGTTVWTNGFGYDSGTPNGPGVLTQMGMPGTASANWTGGVSPLLRVNTETNTVISYPAVGRVNGLSTLTAWLDGQQLAVTTNSSSDPSNPFQWRTLMPLAPGVHQLKVAAEHPSGFFTACATNWFTNNIAQQTAAIGRDPGGNITQRTYTTVDGTIHQQTLFWDAKDRLTDVFDTDSTHSGFYWHAEFDGLNRRLFSLCYPMVNGEAQIYGVTPTTINQYYDPQVEFLELGVAYGTKTEWKLYGPDLNGRYGGLNGVGGLDGVSPYLNTFNSLISDFRGNLLAEVTNNTVVWSPARPTGYGAVPGYRPVALGHGADISLSSAWRGRWPDITGYYQIGLRTYDPVTGMWLSYDSVVDPRNPNGLSAFGGDPIDGFDSDGRMGKSYYNFQMNGGIAGYTLNGVGNALNDYSGDNAYVGAYSAYLGTLFNEAGGAVSPSTYVNGLSSYGHNVASYYNDSGWLPATSYALTSWNVGAVYSGVENFDLQYDTAGQSIGDLYQRGATISGGLASTAGIAAGGLGVYNWATASATTPAMVTSADAAPAADYYLPGDVMPNGEVAGVGPGSMYSGENIPQLAGNEASQGWRRIVFNSSTSEIWVSTEDQLFHTEVLSDGIQQGGWKITDIDNVNDRYIGGNAFFENGEIQQYNWASGHIPGTPEVQAQADNAMSVIMKHN